ncbi:MAG: folate-binding protein [Zetaproteobacteria bacterium]|nr:MAG: folate-binding protein [Zetaproteobacteria bacterium]
MKLDRPLLALRSAWAVVELRGPRAADYLQGQITQDVARAAADRLTLAALLTPQGKAVCDLWFAPEGDEGWLLIVPACAREEACARLRRFSLGYTLTIAPSARRLWSLQGPGSRALARGLDHAWPQAEAADEGVWIVAVEQPELAGVERVDEEIIERGRILRGIPRFGVDWSGYPLNAGLIERGGVSFDKGCYVGQEVTSRMRWRGAIRKRICRLALDGPAPALPAPLCSGQAEVGRMTSAADDGAGGAIGIAQLPIELLDRGARLTLADGRPVEVVDS